MCGTFCLFVLWVVQHRAGEILHEVDHMNVKSLTREQILKKLQGCSSMQMQKRERKPHKEFPAGFDGQTGLETSTLGPVAVTWSDPPMVLGEEPVPQVLLAINGKRVFGMPKQKMIELVENSPESPDSGFEMASVFKMTLLEDLPGHREGIRHCLKTEKVPVHLGVRCSGCGHKPLVGANFTCKNCATHYCSACFKGRAHAHSPAHKFAVQDFPGTTPSDAPVAPKISEGSTVVVIGTGKKQLDGQLGLVTALTSTSSGALPLWSVLMDGSCEAVNLEAKHLFLRPDQERRASAAACELPLPPAEPKEDPKVPASLKPIDPLLMVRKHSLRELRQVEGQEALERFKSQGTRMARKSSFLCKGMCGTMVPKDHQEYIKEGQLAMCEACMKKSRDSEKKTTCGKCKQEFVYSQFFVDLPESSGLPSLCQECQETEWAVISPPKSEP